jgi:hypothetical protein
VVCGAGGGGSCSSGFVRVPLAVNNQPLQLQRLVASPPPRPPPTLARFCPARWRWRGIVSQSLLHLHKLGLALQGTMGSCGPICSYAPMLLCSCAPVLLCSCAPISSYLVACSTHHAQVSLLYASWSSIHARVLTRALHRLTRALHLVSP